MGEAWESGIFCISLMHYVCPCQRWIVVSELQISLCLVSPAGRNEHCSHIKDNKCFYPRHHGTAHMRGGGGGIRCSYSVKWIVIAIRQRTHNWKIGTEQKVSSVCIVNKDWTKSSAVVGGRHHKHWEKKKKKKKHTERRLGSPPQLKSTFTKKKKKKVFG